MNIKEILYIVETNEEYEEKDIIREAIKSLTDDESEKLTVKEFLLKIADIYEKKNNR
jgi:hypothetical protein